MHHFLKTTNRNVLICFVTLYGSVGSLCQAASYPEPEISSMMFHVDKLPLDKDRIEEIVNDLIILASKNANGEKRQLIKNARILAIVMRLDPANEDAKNLNTSFSINEVITEPAPERSERSLRKILGLLRILGQAEKHAEAHTFAAYLKDAIIGLAREHKALDNHKFSKERWENVVPKVK